jgi:dTMP kinase
MEDITELFLFSASRHQLVSEVIAPALERGEIIVCDRYADSTTAYQGYGRKMDLPLIRSINQAATMGVSPDITILVDIPVEEIVKRKKKAGVPFDRMESFGKVFYERVRKGYYELADAEPTRFCVVDGMAPIQEVQQEIWTTVEPKLLIEK